MVTMVKRRLRRRYAPRNDKEDGGQKQIKGGSRKRKIELIEKSNKAWVDIYLTL
jgi:predicted GIY-YIG superfamily endonuclease